MNSPESFPFSSRSRLTYTVIHFRRIVLCWAAALCAGPLWGQQSALVAAWTFDEATGDRVKDISGQGHHGILRGAQRAAGRSGGAVECTQDALVEVPYSPGLDEFSQGITVSAWVKRIADSSWNTVVSREIKDGWSEYFGLAMVENKALSSVNPDGAHYQSIKSDEDVPVGQWVHLVGTYDNAVFQLSINGRCEGSAFLDAPRICGSKSGHHRRQHQQQRKILGGLFPWHD